MKRKFLPYGTPYFLLGLGSNQGDRADNLYSAITALNDIGYVLTKSSVYESAPMYVTNQPKFLNMAVGLQTNLEPLALIHAIKDIEARLGRDLSPETQRYGPRSIDIDIELALHNYFMGDIFHTWENVMQVLDTPELTVPHPRMSERAFVLYPLLEITRPTIQKILEEMLSHIPKQHITRLGYLGELVRHEPLDNLHWVEYIHSEHDGDLTFDKQDLATEEGFERFIRHSIEDADRDWKKPWDVKWGFFPNAGSHDGHKQSLRILEGCITELLHPAIHLQIEHQRVELIPFFVDMLEQYKTAYYNHFQSWGTLKGDDAMEPLYSGRPLSAKLGLKLDMRATFIDAPSGYLAMLGEAAEMITLVPEQDLTEKVDFIHYFVKGQTELERRFLQLKQAMKLNGMLWISWPKGKSQIPTNLNENIIRKIGLAHGLVDVKVCAIDADWSGLKFVYRLKDRK